MAFREANENRMRRLRRTMTWTWLVGALTLGVSGASEAQSQVHWQLEPAGFPAEVTLLVDVEENNKFRHDLSADSFAVSVDEFVGKQGGRILNPGQLAPGIAGAQLLLVVDRSRTYTGEFSRAKRTLREVVDRLDGRRDLIALATTPTDGLDSDAELVQPFTNDQTALQQAIDDLRPLGARDRSTARVCHTLSDSLRLFPEQTGRRFRAVLYLSAGVDRGEGRGDCLEDSFARGKVPFNMLTFTPDRRYLDERVANRVETSFEELAERTGGRSIFRHDSEDYSQFVDQLWRRIRAQYQLEVELPCYRPAPATEHVARLEIDGVDAEPIRFEAASTLAPTPEIESFHPPRVTRSEIDEGEADLTIEGRGFCGSISSVRAQVGPHPISVEKVTPYRLVASVTRGAEDDEIKVINRFGRAGSSRRELMIDEPGPGAEASAALTVLIIIIALLSTAAVVFLALRARRARLDLAAPQGSPGAGPAGKQAKAGAAGAEALNPESTVRMPPISRAWVRRSDGRSTVLSEGANMIGRDPSCAIQLEVPGISREHATLELLGVHGILWLEDLGSTNGTLWRRGADRELERIDGRIRLEPGDEISIGGEAMIVHYES